ncbi:MAG: hypothetical protein K8I60_00080 [Anaerolineae bacterium]|nr:hypothetical protein [Anaerolineae bacterium]
MEVHPIAPTGRETSPRYFELTFSIGRAVYPSHAPKPDSLRAYRIESAKALHQASFSYREIAERLGMSYRQIGAALGIHWTRVGQIVNTTNPQPIYRK